MLSSKANAALTRVKEIEEKYKMKRREQRWNRREDSDSSISSVSLDLSENLPTQLKESSRISPKSKLDIKMPDMRFEGHDESTKLPLQDKQSNRMDQAADEADLDVTMPSEDKSSSRSAGKQESFASDIMTIQENSSIESVRDDSVISSKSLSRSKTSQRLPSAANEQFSRHEGRAKAGPKKKRNQSDKLSEISRDKSSSIKSSIVKRSNVPGKSNVKISELRSNLESTGHSIEKQTVAKTLKRANSSRSSTNSNRSWSSHGNSVIDESIDTLEDGSEIVSELSRTGKNITEKDVDGSVNVSSNSGFSLAEDASADVSSKLKQPAGGNGYANDTFEDISSSTVRSKSRSQSERTIDGKKNTLSLTDNRNTGDVEVNLDKEPLYYNRNIENIDAKTDKRASWRKNSLEMTSASRQESGQEEREKVSDETREHLMTDVIRSPVAGDEEGTERTESSSSRETSEPTTRFDSSPKKSEPTKSDSSKQTSESTKSGSSREKSGPTKSSSSREKDESTKSGSSREKGGSTKSSSSRERGESTMSTLSRKKSEISGEDGNVLTESSDRRIPQNVTNVLRKLHRDSIDAVAKRHASLKTMEQVYESSSGRKIEPEVSEAPSRMTTREEESHRSSKRDGTRGIVSSENNNREQSVKRKKRKARVTYSESVEVRDCAGSRKECKALRYDRKQIRELRRRVVELRLQQEREDLQKYLHELKDLRLGGSGSTPNYFSPLEFPKIAEFTPPDSLDFGSQPDEQLAALRERVSVIRRWLKDQYILYRDYCAVAQAINARYVLTTLEDTKKTIRELRETTIRIR